MLHLQETFVLAYLPSTLCFWAAKFFFLLIFGLWEMTNLGHVW
uniref:Uncharacterized protein n=1 Tax=Rhizophora mucronata TaxID=61149 RepID=A0A2P2MYU2_RHIMU